MFYMDFSSVSIVLALSVPLDSFLNAYWSGVYLSVQPVYKGNELNWSLLKNASRKKKKTMYCFWVSINGLDSWLPAIVKISVGR